MSQVADYNIANASGASVRSDMNSLFDAIKTLNSGGSDPSNPEPFMPYVDTADSNNLKIRNAANNGYTTVGSVDSANLGLLPRTGGTMTGALSFGAGSTSNPSINLGDTTTGFFKPSSNRIGVSVSNAEAVNFQSDGIELLSQRSIIFSDANSSNSVKVKSPVTISNNFTLTLPSSITNGGFLQTDGSGNLSFEIVAGVPTGSVFAMAVVSVPSGYLECNGAAVSRTTYSALFAVIGTAYGTGNGSSTFNLPDLRGEFVRGFDNGRNADTGRSISTSQGSQNASHNHSANSTSTVTDPGHKHNLNFNMGSIISSGGAFGLKDSGNADRMFTATTGISVSTSTSIGNQGGNESRPRNVAMMYIIKI